MTAKRDRRGRFLPGNQFSRKSRPDETEVAALRREIAAFLSRWELTPGQLDDELGYARRGRFTAKVLAGARYPSLRYRRRFAALLTAEADPAWRVSQFSIKSAADPTVPAGRVLAKARQCRECLAEMVEGRRREPDTWWWFGHPGTRICNTHRAAWRRRVAWFRRCLALACPHVVSIAGGGYTCQQEICTLRRWAWRRNVQQGERE